VQVPAAHTVGPVQPIPPHCPYRAALPVPEAAVLDVVDDFVEVLRVVAGFVDVVTPFAVVVDPEPDPDEDGFQTAGPGIV
jgi:hypothetical protein